MVPQEIEGLTPQIRARLNAERTHLRRRHRTHAVKPRHRKGRHEGFGFVGHDRELTVWLTMVRRKLREELVAGDSGRGRELGFLPNARPDFLGGLPRGRDAPGIVGYVEIGLIERQRLYKRSVVSEYLMDLPRSSAVDIKPRRNEYELCALPHGDR